MLDPNGWEASSHRPVRAPKGKPQITQLEPIASVGVVLHLGDVKDEAALTIELKDEAAGKVNVPLKEVLAGKAKVLWNGAAVVRLISTASPVATGKTEDDFPAACYGPDGTLWVAYIGYHVKEEARRIEPPMLKGQPGDFKQFFTPEFGDQLLVKYFKDGKWSKEIAVTGPKEDIIRCAIAAEGNGDVWVVYSAQRSGRHDLYARPAARKHAKGSAEIGLGPEVKLTTDGARNLNPVACTLQNGDVRVTYQRWDKRAQGISEQGVLTASNNKWVSGLAGISDYTFGQGSNSWNSSIAAGPRGEATVAYDYYSGDYDIGLHVHRGATVDNEDPVSSSKFESRPSATYDTKGRLWIAYEEGPEQWGKDYGALDAGKGNPLYNARSVRVVCLDNGKLFKPVAELPTSAIEPPVLPFEALKTNKFERATRYAYPRIGIDGKGRIWLTYRHNFGSRYSSHPGAYWLTFARRLDGDKWSEPIELHHSDGLLDHRPVLLPHKSGGLLVVHNTDGRYTTPDVIDNQIYMSYVDLPGEVVEPKLAAHDPGKKNPRHVQQAQDEADAVKRLRTARVEAGGKTYQYLRGEFHRHTEISWDGAPDGSLEDMFRYGIDAAAMDWIGNGDHDSGAGREYSWWLIQKFTDAYHVPSAFTPMFTYERSVSYPHGHRNCMFAQRGVRTLPRLAPREGIKEEGGVHADDAKMLYRYLREHNGICAGHTSATSMGTDWRDNDPVVEPIVEIYQGDRMSYEMERAPRAGYDPQTGVEPANVAGWFPLGFVKNALLNKGYKLGFQASSDHWSTHISYCIVLAEKHDRQGILDAIKKRHCYGATDNILVDLRSGKHIMGDELKTAQAPTLQINVIGTAALDKLDILRDSDVVATIEPRANQYKNSWTDPQPQPGMHYYYIRILQQDGEIAWSSPMWIEYQK
jgi:hypothetical protein